jgi:hypothetical protein
MQQHFDFSARSNDDILIFLPEASTLGFLLKQLRHLIFLPEATTTFDFTAEATTKFDSSAKATTLGFLLMQQRHFLPEATTTF